MRWCFEYLVLSKCDIQISSSIPKSIEFISVEFDDGIIVEAQFQYPVLCSV